MTAVVLQVDCIWLANQIKDYSSRGIALKVVELINSGSILPGSILPPVRKLAEQLLLSPTAVSNAWAMLRKQCVVKGNTRTGVYVSEVTGPRPERFEQLNTISEEGIGMLDLSWSIPDPALAPTLNKAILQALTTPDLNKYQRIAILPELEQQARMQWPYPAEAFLTTGASNEAIFSIFCSMLISGAPVAVTIPIPALFLDILEFMDATIYPVRCDQYGPVPISLTNAMEHRPVAFLYQPRSNSVTGVSVTDERMQALGDILSATSTTIIEHDYMDALSDQPRLSLGNTYPDRTFHIISYSNAYGADLRLAIMSGPETLIKKVHAFRSFSCGWNSRMLQSTLTRLMQDKKAQQEITNARMIYQQRQQSLVDALVKRGIETSVRDGFNIWLKVPSEEYATDTLLKKGIIVRAGNTCGDASGEYIRITTSLIDPDRIEEVADAIALVFDDYQEWLEQQ